MRKLALLIMVGLILALVLVQTAMHKGRRMERVEVDQLTTALLRENAELHQANVDLTQQVADKCWPLWLQDLPDK